MRGMCGLRFTLAGIVLLFAAAGGLTRASTTLPVPLDKDVCWEEDLHGRVQGHLLFAYFVTALGRVEQPRLIYAKVSPPNLEGKLIGALRACLEKWTFKPGTRDGQTTRVAMMTPFHFFRPAPPDDEQVTLYGGKVIGRSRLEEMREAKLELIDHLFKGRGSRELRGEGWILRTDLGANDVKTLFNSMQVATQAFEAAFPGAPPASADKPAIIVAFRDGLNHAQVDSFDNLQDSQRGSRGTYVADERLVYFAKASMSTKVFSDFLVHETMHHLTTYRFPAGLDLPKWVHEGIAEFLECLKKDGKGAFDFSRFERGRVSSGPYLWPRSAEINLDALEDAAKRKDPVPLPRLLEASWQEFGGDDMVLMYAKSWLLVHYLFNAEGGKLRAPFQAWVLQPPREEGPTDLAAALGRPIAEIEAALPAYLKAIH